MGLREKVGDKVRDKFPTKSRTQIMKVGDVICRGLCRKVGVIEFGLQESNSLRIAVASTGPLPLLQLLI